jgi:limonene 1,2-monooxygenase
MEVAMAPRAKRMEFGLFIPPMHYPRQNPTRALHRDLEMIQYAETLGFTEAWIGEHHSSGHEIIGPNDLFVAAAVERTKHIRIGTGVASLPYHHPYHVAERAILLDHLSMGRTMLGVGPGSLPTDAAMLGVPWSETRSRMVESWEAVYHLISDDAPLTKRTDWFTLEEATMQLAPFSSPMMEIAFTAMESPFGPSLAGKYGGGLISLSGLTAQGFASLSQHWAVVEAEAAKHGHTANRDDWRVVTMIHVADTREAAKEQVRRTLPHFGYYAGAVTERALEWLDPDPDAPIPSGPPTVDDIIEAFGGTKIACIGTPDDAIQTIETIQKATGGFGKILLQSGMDWASQRDSFSSLELFAREVMPHFQGSTLAPVASMERVQRTRETMVAEQRKSVHIAQDNYAATGNVLG